MSEAELTPKEIGGFRILRRLASGATSDVLLARAEGPHGFQRVVALKILLSGARSDETFDKALAREVSAYARLSHPAIVKLYDFFSADGQLVMVLEFVDGLPLHKLRAMLAIAGERIDDRASLFLGLRVFSALAAAHAARDPATGEFSPVGHYDVNPSNVLVPWDGHVKVGDFGIAHAMGAQIDARSGFVKGTYGYIAPEQAARGAISVRADVYSAGLILWELLARRKAVQRGSLSDLEIVNAMVKPDFPSLDLLRPDIDPAVRAAVRRALEPDPDKRGITAEEMVSVLRDAIPGDEGRQTLTKAVARIRPAGDPLATTQSRPPEAGTTPTVERVDPEQTAPFAAQVDDGADLGKIAFYGRINLPRSDQVSPPQQGGGPGALTNSTTSDSEEGPQSRIPTPVVPPNDPSQAVTVPPAPAPLVPGPIPPAVPRKRPGDAGAILNRPISRAIPRPLLVDRKASGFPTVPAPAPEAAAQEADLELLSGRVPQLAPPPAPAEPPAPRPASPVPPPVVAQPAADGAVAPAKDEVPPEAPGAPVVAASAVTEPPPSAAPAPAPVSPPPAPPAPEPPAPASHTVPDRVAADLPPLASDTEVADPISHPLLAPIPEPTEPTRVRMVPKVARRQFPWVLVLGCVTVAAGVGGYVLSTSGQEDSATVSSASASATPASSSGQVAVTSPPPASATPPVASTAPVASPTPTAPASVAPTSPAAPPAASAAPSAPVSVVSVAAAPRPAPTPPTEPVASAPAGVPTGATALPADSGEITPPAAAAGHRVFVDGKVAGEGTDPIRVHCGSHTVRVGSAGTDRKVDVPCGGSLNL